MQFKLYSFFYIVCSFYYITPLFANQNHNYLHVFSSYSDITPQKMEILGKVVSKSLQSNEKTTRIQNYDTRDQILIATLKKPHKIRLNNTIYIVRKYQHSRQYKHSYLIARANVFSIFQTELQGWFVKAKGFLKFVKSGYYIVKPDESTTRRKAIELSQQAQIQFAKKNDKKALVLFKKSLEQDLNNPEVYFKLAMLEKKLSLNIAYHKHLKLAWKYITNFNNPNLFINFLEEYFTASINTIIYDTNFKLPQCSLHKEKACTYLKAFLKLLKQKNMLHQYYYILPSNIQSLLIKKGISRSKLHLAYGRLYFEIYNLLKDKLSKRVNQWLSKEEKNILYNYIYLTPNKKLKVNPTQEWDNAFLKASIHHLKYAHDLQPLQGESAFYLIRISYQNLQKHPTPLEKKHYKKMGVFYGQHLLSLKQDNKWDWNKVRFMLKEIKKK